MERQRAEKLDYAVEVMLDFLNIVADGKDDDEMIFPQAAVNALAEACNTTPPEVEPLTAGEWRRQTRTAKAALVSVQGWLGNHQITEHDDGTITVSPSILIQSTWASEPVQWHGWLEHGVWREA